MAVRMGARVQGVLLIASIFFFQAEDGIRDLTVTGVQTCALPICGDKCPAFLAAPPLERPRADGIAMLTCHPIPSMGADTGTTLTFIGGFDDVARSEEHTSELQSQSNLVCRLLLEKKKNKPRIVPRLKDQRGVPPAPSDLPTYSPSTRPQPY